MSFSDFLIAQFKGWRRREVVWLLFCVLSIAGLSLYWRDSLVAIVAAVSGMMYTILAGKGKSACFLFGLVNTPIYAYLSFRQGFYGDFALNVYY
ncbi:MAG: nicotinamide mononucleotide transporter, partial [Kiritimatiellae bacterium]|nr:nicotinamide mononucleotide transporter [Kiritimatiellia bacterium]